MPGQRRKKTCQCSVPKPREIESNGGDNLGTVCEACTLPIQMRCPICRHGFLSLPAHLRASECGARVAKNTKELGNPESVPATEEASGLLKIINDAGFDLRTRNHTVPDEEEISSEVPI